MIHQKIIVLDGEILNKFGNPKNKMDYSRSLVHYNITQQEIRRATCIIILDIYDIEKNFNYHIIKNRYGNTELDAIINTIRDRFAYLSELDSYVSKVIKVSKVSIIKQVQEVVLKWFEDEQDKRKEEYYLTMQRKADEMLNER